MNIELSYDKIRKYRRKVLTGNVAGVVAGIVVDFIDVDVSFTGGLFGVVNAASVDVPLVVLDKVQHLLPVAPQLRARQHSKNKAISIKQTE